MALSITGKVHEVGKAQQVTEKLKKQVLVLEISENADYKEYPPFEAVNDRCKLLDELREGDMVMVHFNLRGRQYTDKAGKKSYFGSNGIWKIDVLKTTAAPTYTPPSAQENPDHDLPF